MKQPLGPTEGTFRKEGPFAAFKAKKRREAPSILALHAMEQMGIEPTTSTLRTWRSPN